MGIGSILIEHAIALAHKEGCISDVLNATVENIDAHKLYNRHGFTHYGHHRLTKDNAQDLLVKYSAADLPLANTPQHEGGKSR